MNSSNLLRRLKHIKKGQFLGDTAGLKLQLSAKKDHESPYFQAALSLKDLSFKPLNLKELDSFPTGSLGRTYADFLKENNLKPLNFSSLSYEAYQDYPVSMRYVRIHDFVHCLLKFKTDIVGEVGVYAFIKEQGYNQTLNRAARFAMFSTKVFFWQKQELSLAIERGRGLAQGATPLILKEFESRLEEPILQLREEWIPNFR